MHAQHGSLPVSLLDVLRNTLVLGHIGPYIGLPNLVRLAATSKPLQDLIYGNPAVFRHTDLTELPSRIFNPSHTEVGAMELETTDQFYARPVRRVFRSLQQHNVLHDVRTLVLDGLAIPLTILTDILCNDAHNVRMLSLRGVKALGDEKLIQVLRYIIRPGRPDGVPKLKGLYYFTPTEAKADYSVRRASERFPLAPEICVGSIICI